MHLWLEYVINHASTRSYTIHAISVLQAQNNTKDYDQRKLRTRNAPVFAEIALMETMTG